MSCNDLFVLAADADALSVIEAVLTRSKDLGIRPILFKVERHTYHDAGLVTKGPEWVRSNIIKKQYRKVLLLWDHHGSGWENRDPLVSQDMITKRLADVTWKDNSAAIVMCPELEEWLWHDSKAVRKYLQLSETDFRNQLSYYAKKKKITLDEAQVRQPKELIQSLFLHTRHYKKMRPADFTEIVQRANLKAWRQSASFRAMAETLQSWFPAK